MKEMGKKIREEEKYKEMMLKDLKISGVGDFGDSAVTIKMITHTMPLKQWGWQES